MLLAVQLGAFRTTFLLWGCGSPAVGRGSVLLGVRSSVTSGCTWQEAPDGGAIFSPRVTSGRTASPGRAARACVRALAVTFRGAPCPDVRPRRRRARECGGSGVPCCVRALSGPEFLTETRGCRCQRPVGTFPPPTRWGWGSVLRAGPPRGRVGSVSSFGPRVERGDRRESTWCGGSSEYTGCWRYLTAGL